MTKLKQILFLLLLRFNYSMTLKFNQLVGIWKWGGKGENATRSWCIICVKKKEKKHVSI